MFSLSRRIAFGTILGVLVAAQSALAPISGSASIAQLQETADLIVAGSASGGIQVGGVLNFTIRVSRVVKGDILPGISIPANWPSTDPAFAASGNGLWFLKQSPGGWRVLPLQSGFATFQNAFIPIPAGPLPAPYAYNSAAASVTDKLASEISAATENGNGLVSLFGLHQTWLDELHSPVVQVLYRRMSDSSSIQQKILGLSGLIRGGEAAALNSAVEGSSEFAKSRLEFGILLNSIGNDFRSSDARSVAVLGGAVVNSGLPLDLREGAAHALRGIHTKDALPYLAGLLDDPDTKLQAEGVGGLGSFANGLPIQTPASIPSLSYLQRPEHALYRTEETEANFALGEGSFKYVTFWKNWWEQNKTALGY